MRKITSKLLITVLLTGLINMVSYGQAQQPELQKIITEKDSLFWRAYNECDITTFRKYVSDNVEFYHDKGGITLGIEALAASVENNLCKKPGFRLRRAIVPGTFKIYPLENNGAVYGAVVSGDHDFFITENGKAEFHSGRAKFTHLWILANNEWKMTRILSYDHHSQ